MLGQKGREEATRMTVYLYFPGMGLRVLPSVPHSSWTEGQDWKLAMCPPLSLVRPSRRPQAELAAAPWCVHCNMNISVKEVDFIAEERNNNNT